METKIYPANERGPSIKVGDRVVYVKYTGCFVLGNHRKFPSICVGFSSIGFPIFKLDERSIGEPVWPDHTRLITNREINSTYTSCLVDNYKVIENKKRTLVKKVV